MTPPYGLLALDVDGTLIVDDHPVTPRVRRAISAAQDAGVKVTIATGRMFQSARRFAHDLGVTVPIICYHGALVRHPLTEETLVSITMAVDPALDVVHFADEAGLHVNAYVDDQLYMRRMTPEGAYYAKIARVEANVVEDFESVIGRGSTKLVIVTDEPRVLGVVDQLRKRVGDVLYVTRSHPRFAEATSPTVSKGYALRQLATHLGVPIEQTMAVGDNLNDLDLVTEAGLGVAMGDGDPRVRAAADFVTGTYFEDGVATAIERFILNAPPKP